MGGGGRSKAVLLPMKTRSYKGSADQVARRVAARLEVRMYSPLHLRIAQSLQAGENQSSLAFGQLVDGRRVGAWLQTRSGTSS